MHSAFAPKSIKREVRGVPVTARSYTLAESFDHQEKIKSGVAREEIMAGMVAACCMDADGNALFESAQDAMQMDHQCMSDLVDLALEANGLAGKEGGDDDLENPTA